MHQIAQRRALAAREASSVKFEEERKILPAAALRRRQAVDSFLAIADRVAEAGIAPMSMEEIDSEVKAMRAARKQRRSGR